jgi:uncharacterized membrane protein SirB2
MHTGMLHTHLLSVTLFLIIYLVKAYYLVTDQKEGLVKWTKWTKIPEMVVSFLFLATGIYLAVKMEKLEIWFWVKIAAVFASIPLAIIGVKKENKMVITAAVILLIYAFGVAESRSITFTNSALKNVVTNPQAANYDVNKHGAAIYKIHCERCHGENGKLGLQGAADLANSTMDIQQRATIITMGKTVMPSYQNTLNKPGEIEAVAIYIERLRK